MKSPQRPPLKPTNTALMDPSYLAKKEKERRKLIRLQQVRLRSAEAARTVRQRVRREQHRQVRLRSFSLIVSFPNPMVLQKSINIFLHN